MHNSIHPQSLIRAAGLWAAGVTLTLVTAAAVAAPAGSPSEIQARYEQDRAKCVSGNAAQDRATCLKEAGAARDAARRNQLDDGDAKYKVNAKERCDTLTGDEAKACLARMRGKGAAAVTSDTSGTRSTTTTTTSGSVEGGGILRETLTREVKPVEPAASVAPSR